MKIKGGDKTEFKVRKGGNEKLLDWFDGYCCRNCNLVCSYGDLDVVEIETGETYEVEYEDW
ncbi:hypothetical protein AM596_16555 [Clostridium perfringens CP4]|uniref:hypothetical protein n=1 Tax=Clostridium perfringens TaxID=1502 RepID=UPI000707DF83|nr:hypothetical protein [Clostridium perfringens]KQC91079.1 hypothetical protein AM596_16555 [Clostridium perfringens CP4]